MDRTESVSPLHDRAVAILESMGVGDRAKRSGEAAPDISLPDTSGQLVRLSELWAQGPLVIIFFRGGWCSYCNLRLHAWQQYADVMHRLGARLVAISPQTPENSIDTAGDHELTFPVLSDSNLEAASGFNIAFTLPPELVELLASTGTDVPVLNGNGLWVLPVPATYVIDRTGVIRFADIEADYRVGVEPRDVIDAVSRLT